MAQPSGKKARSVVQLSMVPDGCLRPRRRRRTAARRGLGLPPWFELPPPRDREDGPGRIVELLGSPFETYLRGRAIRGWTYGEGPVVYLVHGWSGHAEQLGPLVRHLLAQGLKVVAFDGLSHGRSDAGVHGSGSSDAGARPLTRRGRCEVRPRPCRRGPLHGCALGTRAARRMARRTERLVLIASVEGVPDFLARFRRSALVGGRSDVSSRAEQRTGYPWRTWTWPGSASSSSRGLSCSSSTISGTGRRRTSPRPGCGGIPGAELYSTVGLGHRRILADAAVGGTAARFAARLPVEPSLHAGDVPRRCRSSSSGRAAA